MVYLKLRWVAWLNLCTEFLKIFSTSFSLNLNHSYGLCGSPELLALINKDNKSECSPIRSLIIRDSNKIGIWFVTHQYDYIQKWLAQGPVTNWKNLGQNLRDKLGILWKFSSEKTTVNSTKCAAMARALYAHCPIAQAWRVDCSVTSWNYKHDAYIVLFIKAQIGPRVCLR